MSCVVGLNKVTSAWVNNLTSPTFRVFMESQRSLSGECWWDSSEKQFIYVFINVNYFLFIKIIMVYTVLSYDNILIWKYKTASVMSGDVSCVSLVVLACLG